MDVNGNTVKKFDSSVWNIFDVPTDVSSGSAETLSITLFRTMSSDFEIKLVDLTNGGGEGIYYIPAAQMPVNQWVTVDIPMSSFRGNDSMTGGPIAADLNIDQLVVKPMNNYDPSVDGPRETFYMDDMYFSGSGIGVGTDTGTGTDTGGSTATYDSVTLDYETVEGTGANVVFDGGQATVITATGSTGSDTQVLEVVKGTGGATWAGVKLLIAEAGSNLIADPTAAITVDVWSPNADGSVTLKLEGPNGSTEETFGGLTSGWNAISWTPSSTQPMDTLVFFPDLGAVAADQTYYIDQVRITGADLAEPAGGDTGTDTGVDTGTDTGSDTGSTPVELLADGGFADGTGWSGNALNVVDGVSRADVGSAGNPWDVSLSGAVELTSGDDYTLVFEARGAEGRALKAGIGDAGAPYHNDVADLTLADGWQTYTLHLTALDATTWWRLHWCEPSDFRYGS